MWKVDGSVCACMLHESSQLQVFALGNLGLFSQAEASVTGFLSSLVPDVSGLSADFCQANCCGVFNMCTPL